MSVISDRMRREVILRASNRCEYCQLSQAGQEATFHVDHVIPRSVGGPTVLENLALACVSCSLLKGARQTATDPETGLAENLFNPRLDAWSDHFQWDGAQLTPRTASGRATVAALDLNRLSLVAIREEEMFRNRHPPP